MHILVKLLLLFLLAMLSATLSWPFLGWLGFAVITVACVCFFEVFYKIIKRIKWLIIFMVLIYAYSTPGEYVPFAWSALSPTYEGLQLGGTQGLKIVTMLAGLAILLGSTTKRILVGGLFQILQPMRYFGLKVEPFAVRLWLTLHYVETQEKIKYRIPELRTFLREAGREMCAESVAGGDQLITIQVAALRRLDVFLLLLIFVILVGMWGWR